MFSIHNTGSAMMAGRFAGIHQSNMSKALARLSSGLKINSAADDASGLAMVQRMRAQLAQLDVSRQNTLDQLSKTELADSVLSGVSDMMQRMNELATKAASGTVDASDREAMNAEYQALLDEIKRSGKATYNEVSLFSKNFTQGNYTSNVGEIRGPIAEGAEGETVISGGNLSAYLDGLDKLLADISQAAKKNDTEALKALGIDSVSGASDKEKLHQAIEKFTAEQGQALLNSEGVQGDYKITISNGGVKISGGVVPKGAFGLEGTSIATQEGAQNAMDTLKDAMKNVSKSRAEYGAMMNRIEHTLNNISSMENNLSDSISRIADADMAKEMTNYTKSQILMQVAQAMMAQANGNSKDTAAFLKSMLAS